MSRTLYIYSVCMWRRESEAEICGPINYVRLQDIGYVCSVHMSLLVQYSSEAVI